MARFRNISNSLTVADADFAHVSIRHMDGSAEAFAKGGVRKKISDRVELHSRVGCDAIADRVHATAAAATNPIFMRSLPAAYRRNYFRKRAKHRASLDETPT
jgi:hypothetical protein